MMLRNAVEDKYWSTLQGIKQRIAMLGEDFVYGMQNNALQLLASENNVSVEWSGYLDNRICQICEPKVGNQYRVGQFIPRLPAHPNCRCSWILIPK